MTLPGGGGDAIPLGHWRSAASEGWSVHYLELAPFWLTEIAHVPGSLQRVQELLLECCAHCLRSCFRSWAGYRSLREFAGEFARNVSSSRWTASATRASAEEHSKTLTAGH